MRCWWGGGQGGVCEAVAVPKPNSTSEPWLARSHLSRLSHRGSLLHSLGILMRSSSQLTRRWDGRARAESSLGSGSWARNSLQRGQKSSREKKCVVLNPLDNQCPRCPFLTVLNSLKSQLFECPYGLNSRRNRNVFSDLPPMSSSPLVVWGLLRFQHLSMTRFGVFYLCRHHVLHHPVEILHSSWSWKGHGREPSRTSWEKYFLSIVAFHQKLRCFGWTLVHKPSADWESLLLVFSLLFSRPTNLF